MLPSLCRILSSVLLASTCHFKLRLSHPGLGGRLSPLFSHPGRHLKEAMKKDVEEQARACQLKRRTSLKPYMYIIINPKP